MDVAAAAAVSHAILTSSSLTQVSAIRCPVAPCTLHLASVDCLCPQLDLSRAGITNAGAITIAKAMQVNRSITELDLRGNVIKCVGVPDYTCCNLHAPWLCCARVVFRFVGAAALAEAASMNNVWCTLLVNGSGGLPLLELRVRAMTFGLRRTLV